MPVRMNACCHSCLCEIAQLLDVKGSVVYVGCKNFIILIATFSTRLSSTSPCLKSADTDAIKHIGFNDAMMECEVQDIY